MRTAYRNAIIGELEDEGSGNHPYTANNKGVIDQCKGGYSGSKMPAIDNQALSRYLALSPGLTHPHNDNTYV